MQDIWSEFMLNKEVQDSLEIPEERRRKLKKSMTNVRVKELEKRPAFIDYSFRKKSDGTIINQKKQGSIPRKNFSRKEYDLLHECTYRSLDQIINIHRALHPSVKLPAKLPMVITNDGVAEAKSSSRSYNAWCVRFLPCEKVHAFRISKDYEKGKSHFSEDLDYVIEEIK